MQLADPGLGVDDAVPDSEAEMDHSFTPTRLEREGAQAGKSCPYHLFSLY